LHCTFGLLLQCICLFLDSALHFRRTFALHKLVSGISTALPVRGCIALACFLDSVLHFRFVVALHILVSGFCTALPAIPCIAQAIIVGSAMPNCDGLVSLELRQKASVSVCEYCGHHLLL
jgi:hypothetical protein